MKATNNLSKLILVIYIFSLPLISISAQSDRTKSKAIVEATLKYIPAGGTREINYPSGYLLAFPKWIVEPKEAGTNVFVESKTDLQKFIGKRVHVKGKYENVPSEKISRTYFIKGYERILADTVYCIE